MWRGPIELRVPIVDGANNRVVKLFVTTENFLEGKVPFESLTEDTLIFLHQKQCSILWIGVTGVEKYILEVRHGHLFTCRFLTWNKLIGHHHDAQSFFIVSFAKWLVLLVYHVLDVV